MLKCCDERLLSGADMLEREMGMGRGLFEKGKPLDGDARGQFGPELRLYIHSRAIMFYIVGSTPHHMAAGSMIRFHTQVDRMVYVDQGLIMRGVVVKQHFGEGSEAGGGRACPVTSQSNILLTPHTKIP